MALEINIYKITDPALLPDPQKLKRHVRNYLNVEYIPRSFVDTPYIPKSHNFLLLEENPHVSIVCSCYPMSNEDAFFRFLSDEQTADWIKNRGFHNQDQILQTYGLIQRDKSLWLMYS